MRWFVGMWLLLAPAVGLADGRLERMEEHQRVARIGLVIGATAPTFVLAAAAMGEGTPVGARAGVAAVGVAGSAAGLTLLGRRSMKAATLLDLSGGGGAVALFFDIAAVATGTHYVIAGQSTASGMGYLIASAGALTAGGLQLRRSRFVADMRTDPRVLITPTGATVVGRF
jgi:hypothetical protein